MKPVSNPFTFMMANRHKQDEIIKDIEEQEKTNITVELNLDNGDLKSPPNDFEIEVSKVSSSSNAAKQNAFQLLMSSRKKCLDIDSDNNCNAKLESTTRKIKKKKKLSKILSETSSEDSCDDSIFFSKYSKQLNYDCNFQNGVSNVYGPLCDENDVKSKLINENEYFNIEETFKEEILECVSKKKRKKRKLKKCLESCEEVGTLVNLPKSKTETNATFMDSQFKNDVNCVSSDKVQRDENWSAVFQPNIKHFFKQISKKSDLPNHTEEVLDVMKSEYIDMNKNSKDLPPETYTNAKESKSNDDEGLNKSNGNAFQFNGKLESRPTCLKLKTLTLRSFRNVKHISESVNKNENNLLDICSNIENISKSRTDVKNNSKSKKEISVDILSGKNASNEIFKSKNMSSEIIVEKEPCFLDSIKKVTVKGENLVDNINIERKKEINGVKLVNGSLESKSCNGAQNNTKKMSKHKEVNSKGDTKQLIEEVENCTSNLRRSCRTIKKPKFLDAYSDEECEKEIKNIEKIHAMIEEEKMQRKSNCRIREKSSKKLDEEEEPRKNEDGNLRRSNRSGRTYKLFEIFREESSSEKEEEVSSNTSSELNTSSNDESEPIKRTRRRKEAKILSSDKKRNSKMVKKAKHKERGRLKKMVPFKSKGSSDPLQSQSGTVNGVNSAKDDESESEVQIITLDKSPQTSEPKKMAPIFLKSKPPVMSPTKLKARTEFFFSDVPETLKKLSAKISEEQQLTIAPFPKYNHILQCQSDENLLKLGATENLLPQTYETEEDHCIVDAGTASFKEICFLNNKRLSRPEPLRQFQQLNSTLVCYILAYLKDIYRTFPVISVYNSYKESKEEFLKLYEKESAKESLIEEDDDCLVIKSTSSALQENKLHLKSRSLKRKKKVGGLLKKKRRKLEDSIKSDNDNIPWHKSIPYEWTQVFAPRTSEFFIGNLESIIELKEWLVKWKTTLKSEGSEEENSTSEDDSSDSHFGSFVENSVLIKGSTGIGKTCAVYALANELGYKVLEVNASSCRQGKQLTSQLSEATLSHTVSSVNSTAQISASKTEDYEDQKEKSKKMSLILIEDVDIVFEEADDGFWLAVNNLMATSKRPIIMTSSLSAITIVPKLKENYRLIHFRPTPPQTIAKYLQLMCLANGVFASLKELELLLECNNANIRKTVQDLQVWILSGNNEVHFWKKDDLNELLKQSLKLEDSGDIKLQSVFPSSEEISAKFVDLPISLGCIWSKSDAKRLKHNVPLSEVEPPLNWALLSGNSSSLLPFPKREREKYEKYPLKEEDSYLKNTIQWQKYSWLSLEDDQDFRGGVCEQQSHSISEVTSKCDISKEATRSCFSCLKGLHVFFDSIADFDILSHSSNRLNNVVAPEEFRNKWWTPNVLPGLGSYSSDTIDSSNYNNLNSSLIPDLTKLTLNVVEDCVAKATSSLQDDQVSPMCLEVLNKAPHLLQPHCNDTQSVKSRMETLNQELSTNVADGFRPNRDSVVVDYLPYLREIGRSDQVGEAILKFKRSRRFLKYFSQLNIHNLDKSQLIDICNFFQ